MQSRALSPTLSVTCTHLLCWCNNGLGRNNYCTLHRVPTGFTAAYPFSARFSSEIIGPQPGCPVYVFSVLSAHAGRDLAFSTPTGMNGEWESPTMRVYDSFSNPHVPSIGRSDPSCAN